uniref:Uncharacterized protein n=1 Tax=Romanomermis culicivorax TaxID=13658 RepID=A0A915JCS9_ROMCU
MDGRIMARFEQSTFQNIFQSVSWHAMIKTSSDEIEQQLQRKRPPEKKKRTKNVSVKKPTPLKKPVKAVDEEIRLEDAIEDQKPAAASRFRERGGKPAMVPFPLPENFESQPPPASSAIADIVVNDEVDTGEAEAEKKDLLNVGDVIGGYLRITSKSLAPKWMNPKRRHEAGHRNGGDETSLTSNEIVQFEDA